MPEHLTSGTGSGSWLATPTAKANQLSPSMAKHPGCKAWWQTPVADDAVNRAAGKFNSRGEPKLSAEVLMWPTPYASDVRTYRLNAPGRQSHDRSLCSIMRREEQGHLCPDWVEGYLMGWPIGWTSLEPIGWGDWWDQTWWDEEPCPRITTIKTNRVSRLKAIGNGQVPACVVMAWSLLSKG